MLDFWVDDNRKLIKIAVPSQGVEAYQEGFEPLAPATASKLANHVEMREALQCIWLRSWKLRRLSSDFT